MHEFHFNVKDFFSPEAASMHHPCFLFIDSVHKLKLVVSPLAYLTSRYFTLLKIFLNFKV